jgi:UDP-GlcNAc:undecaprenyl-phosphate GlcNAc-1-phosphate transferase
MLAMTTLCLLLAAVSLAVSLPLCWGCIYFGHRWGLTDNPDAPPDTSRAPPASSPATAALPAGRPGRKWHARPTPNTGGIALLLAIALPVLIALALVWLDPAKPWLPEHLAAALRRHIPGLHRQTPMALAIVLGALALHILGVIDDRRRLGPWIKLAVQLAVAAALAAGAGVRVLTFLADWYGPAGAVASVVLSILWITAITNAMNFLDNMDGLSGGVGAILAALYLAAALLAGQWFVAGLAAMVLGALLGFLVFNFPPARLFLGDGGSLPLGFLLAVISMRASDFAPFSLPGSRPEALVLPGHWYGVLMPVVVMAVPLYDLVSVTLIRLCRGRSPLVADRNHFSHRLVRRGLSPRSAVLVIYLATLATGLGGVMLGTLQRWQAALVAVQVLATLATLALLEASGPGEPKRGPAA